MPLYSFECEGKHVFDRYVKLADFDAPQICECGAVAVRRICPVFVSADIQGYASPIDGRWVGSRAQRREDLRRNGCVEWEPGFREEGQKRRAREDAELFRRIEETADREIAAMPARKRERLAGEMEAGVTATVIRKENSNA